MKIYFDKEKCSACGACVLACTDQNDIDVEHGVKPLRRTFTTESETGKLEFFSESCRHCVDAGCIEACPEGCIFRDEGSGLVISDNEACTGCRCCLAACPYDVPSFGVDGKMLKCDGCIERQKAGMLPACVKICPTGALSLGEA